MGVWTVALAVGLAFHSRCSENSAGGGQGDFSMIATCLRVGLCDVL